MTQLVAKCSMCRSPAMNPNNTPDQHPYPPNLCHAHALEQKWYEIRPRPHTEYEYGCAYCGNDTAQARVVWSFRDLSGDCWPDLSMENRATDETFYMNWDYITEYVVNHLFQNRRDHLIASVNGLTDTANIWDTQFANVVQEISDGINIASVYCESCEEPVEYDID